MHIYDLIANIIEVFHVFIIIFFLWGIRVSMKNKIIQERYKTPLRIHFILTIFLLPVQILCAGCPLTSIGNQFRLMAHPERSQVFINGGFIARLCQNYLGFTPSETIIVIVTVLLIMMYFGNRLWIYKENQKI